jgi:hypothetical protein
MSMVTPTEVADRDGTTPQRVTKWARKFAAAGQLDVEHDSRGRIARFDVAQFDALYQRFRDPVKVRTKTALVGADSDDGARDGDRAEDGDDSLGEGQRRKIWLEVEQRQLALREKRGELVPMTNFIEHVNTVGSIVLSALDGILEETEELAAAVGRDGEHGLRIALRQALDRARHRMADEFERLAALTPKMENDEALFLDGVSHDAMNDADAA